MYSRGCIPVQSQGHTCDLQPCLGAVPVGLTFITPAFDHVPADFSTSHFQAYLGNSRYEDPSIKYSRSNFTLCLPHPVLFPGCVCPSLPHLSALDLSDTVASGYLSLLST